MAQFVSESPPTEAVAAIQVIRKPRSNGGNPHCTAVPERTRSAKGLARGDAPVNTFKHQVQLFPGAAAVAAIRLTFESPCELPGECILMNQPQQSQHLDNPDRHPPVGDPDVILNILLKALVV